MTNKVQLCPVDSKIPNLALMRLGAWHRELGDDVSVYQGPLLGQVADLIYASKQFNYTDDCDFPDGVEVIRGGTGYSDGKLLTQEQDTIYPAYDLFNCEFALGRLTRGCIRNCPWCVVPKVDGQEVRQVAELADFWRGQTHLRLLDDNLMALPDLFIDTCNKFNVSGVRVKWEALDIRLLTKSGACALAKVKRWGNIHFAFDRPEYQRYIERGVKTLKDAGIPLSAITFYVLIGFNTTPEQDMERIEILRSLGVNSYICAFDKTDRYQMHFMRWVNAKMIFKSVSWDEYADERFSADIRSGKDRQWRYSVFRERAHD